MNINLVELEQHEAAWLAYGKRRASRLVWRKATNADVVANLDVALLAQKIEAHDKRVWIARAAARLFTGIERQRALLAYRLGWGVLVALKTLPTTQTMVVQQPHLDALKRITVRASRFSWFKKPVNAFMSWVTKAVGPALVVAVPKAEPVPRPENPLNNVLQNVQQAPQFDALHVEASLAQFREKVENDKLMIVSLYRECQAAFFALPTTAEKVKNFDTCFKPFKKELNKLFLYYHPDKVSAEKSSDVGLNPEIFAVEAAAAFQYIRPLSEELKKQSLVLNAFFEHDLDCDRRLEKIAEGIRKLNEANRAFFEKYLSPEAIAAEKAANEAIFAKLREFKQETESFSASINNFKQEIHQAQTTLDSHVDELTSKIEMVSAALLSRAQATNLSSERSTTPSAQAMPSVNPNAFFATTETSSVHQDVDNQMKQGLH